MDSTILAAVIGGAFLVGSAALGWVWAVHERHNRSNHEQTVRSHLIETAMTRRINEVETELLAFKLSVAEKYASIPHLQDVEARLADNIDRLSELVERLRESFPWTAPTPRRQRSQAQPPQPAEPAK